MFTPILLAILVSASPADEDGATPAQIEPLKISIGNMSFLGDAIKLTKSDDGAFECTIDGSARFTLGADGDTDIAIAAQKLVVERNAKFEITIQCTGDCRLTDSEHTCSADRMQIRFAKQFNLELTGNSRVQYGTGDDRTTLSAESISFYDGTFRVWEASLKHGQ